MTAAETIGIVTWEPGCRLFLANARGIVMAYAPGSSRGKYVTVVGQFVVGDPPSLGVTLSNVVAGHVIELEEDNPGFYSSPLAGKPKPTQPPAPPPRVFHPADNPRARVEWHQDGTCFVNGPSGGHQQSWAYNIDKLEHFVSCGTWCEILPNGTTAAPPKSKDIPATGFEEAW